ncbi:hypothetical protein TSOC_009176 [Tetrabaena socialis]|uniref:Uncharacterized protein n=1 Tax=Tetrabaena socialis TaxID=47790 RepID=A0A2J7ZWK9_9CHLO|nr:hypothetical protein TSOC_009176 [Tetrabaena socialis]|eukprot:PNH04635.1 hypothetical protein TSOC_009176 [Tetrabaena socialis]
MQRSGASFLLRSDEDLAEVLRNEDLKPIIKFHLATLRSLGGVPPEWQPSAPSSADSSTRLSYRKDQAKFLAEVQVRIRELEYGDAPRRPGAVRRGTIAPDDPAGAGPPGPIDDPTGAGIADVPGAGPIAGPPRPMVDDLGAIPIAGPPSPVAGALDDPTGTGIAEVPRAGPAAGPPAAGPPAAGPPGSPSSTPPPPARRPSMEAQLAARRTELHAHRMTLLHAWIAARQAGAVAEAPPQPLGVAMGVPAGQPRPYIV